VPHSAKIGSTETTLNLSQLIFLTKRYGIRLILCDGKEKGNSVMAKLIPTCKNGHKMIWNKTTFSYEEDGIFVEVSDIPAWICLKCDDVSFTPGPSQQLITAVRELIAATKRTRAKNIPLYEYHVKAA
jgi:YgiT-type zinc finger domain-containing protein